jgi:hypothetical protein
MLVIGKPRSVEKSFYFCEMAMQSPETSNFDTVSGREDQGEFLAPFFHIFLLTREKI